MAKSTRKHPTFTDCMTMMRSRDAQVQEDGFHFLRDQVHGNVEALVESLRTESNPALTRWLLELLTFARDVRLIPMFVAHLHDADEGLRHWAEIGLRNLDTKEARTALFAAGRRV
jgi:hypothetical protein